MWHSVDPWPRIEFYVRNGLVSSLPTPGQLEQASKRNMTGFAIAERAKYFFRHPEELFFPTRRRKQALMRTPRAEMDGMRKAEPQGPRGRRPLEQPTALVDRGLRSAYQLPAVRFLTACYFNPYIWPPNATAVTGLTIPLKNLISHVCHEPHYAPLWDVQIIHADEGGLDQLEQEIERSSTDSRLKYRVYRAMTQSASYYDELRDLVPRVRRFEYPDPPPGYGLVTTNLVHFLNYATSL
jgi:hypothetical protein